MEGIRDTWTEMIWERHSNPKSGWSRVLTLPAILYTVYQRNWRGLIGVLAFLLFNPVLFSPPEDDEAWMTRVVLAERWWTSGRKAGVFDTSYPNVLNLLNIPAVGYAFIAAYRRQPLRATIACVVSMALKFWYVGALVRRYDAQKNQSSKQSR